MDSALSEIVGKASASHRKHGGLLPLGQQPPDLLGRRLRNFSQALPEWAEGDTGCPVPCLGLYVPAHPNLQSPLAGGKAIPFKIDRPSRLIARTHILDQQRSASTTFELIKIPELLSLCPGLGKTGIPSSWRVSHLSSLPIVPALASMPCKHTISGG